MTNDKNIEQLTNELPTIGPKLEQMKKILSLGRPGDTLYQVIGKDYMVNYMKHINQKPENNHNEKKPIVEIVTIPGSVGEIYFDKWLAAGWTCANMIDANHPKGQEEALEALRGYDKRGALTTEFRDSTEDSLSPARLKYLGTFEGRFEKWARTQPRTQR